MEADTGQASEAERAELMSEIGAVLESTEAWIGNILEKLDWTEEHLLKNEPMVQCPVDVAHRLPKSSLEKHLKYCRLEKLGYTRKEIDESRESLRGFYEKSNTVVSIDLDDATVARVLSRAGGIAGPLPLTPARMATEFTQQERFQLRRYCVETAKAANQQVSIPREELQMLQEEGEEGSSKKTRLQMMAEQRDMKRRRQTYRGGGKSVHTAKKAYKDVIKEVIENQTSLLGRKWQDERRDSERRSQPEVRSRESSRSRDRHKHKKHKKHKDRDRDRDKDRERKSERDKRKQKDKEVEIGEEREKKVDVKMEEEQRQTQFWEKEQDMKVERQ